MAETVQHPDMGAQPEGGGPTGTSRWQKVVGGLGVLVVLWVGNDTYKVIDGDFGGGGPAGGGHGPGQNAPADRGDREPDGGGGHRPGPPPGGH